MIEKEELENPETVMEEQEQPATESQEQEMAGNEERPDPQAAPEDGMGTLKAQNEELKDKYLRLYAEFENYKKRTLREKIDYMSTAAQDTLTALLPVLDDFDRAKKAADAENSPEPFSEGVNLVYNKLHTILKGKGLTIMESTGQPFDPEFHEAVVEIPAPTEDMKGKVVDTIEKGYMLKEKIIRHARVVVGK